MSHQLSSRLKTKVVSRECFSALFRFKASDEPSRPRASRRVRKRSTWRHLWVEYWWAGPRQREPLPVTRSPCGRPQAPRPPGRRCCWWMRRHSGCTSLHRWRRWSRKRRRYCRAGRWPRRLARWPCPRQPVSGPEIHETN